MQDKHGREVTVRHDPDSRRYLISYPDDELGQTVGLADYQDRAGADGPERIFFHTEVDEAHGGRGLASLLIGEAVADTAATGRCIVPVCPFVRGYLERQESGRHWRAPTDVETAEFNEEEK